MRELEVTPQPPDRQQPAAPPPASAAPPKPLGPWKTAAWGVAASALWFAAHFVVLQGYGAWWLAAHPGRQFDLERIYYDGYLTSLSYAVATLSLGGAIAVAVRRTGWPLAGYLALDRPRRPVIIRSALYVVVLLLALHVLSHLLGRETLPPSVRDAYLGARESGAAFLAFTVIVVGPVGEEILFRGFLFRGWAASRVDVGGTILLTSTIWALIHFEYEWVEVFEVFCTGVLLGWLRWRSGSTTLAILMHGLINLVATIETVVYFEWPS